MKNLEYLESPMTIEEIKSIAKDDYIKDIIVPVSKHEILECDYEQLTDLLSMKICGSTLLSAVEERIVGCDADKELILFSVSAEIWNLLDALSY